MKTPEIIIPRRETTQPKVVELEDFLPSNSPELGAGEDASASGEKLIGGLSLGVGKNEEISGALT